ncbi:MAG TPA: bifunctional riboflavin kinase/FAD synthetase, partial [Myxococcota bacterium]|nr:bifunctional riboflavin kinase/FAD synthetase [Myxococcota bacterium]
FDGVHRGHQALVAAAVARAHETGGAAVVLTFDPHPARVLRPEAAPSALSTLAQKEELVMALGIDRLVALAFDAQLAALSPAAFVREVLASMLGARHVVVGESFRFGHERQGDARTLEALGGQEGFDVQVVPPVLHAGRPISSSRVRAALAAGDVREAALLLGRPYALDGRVVRGDGRGRTLGIPTANLRSEDQLLPARGVYASRALVPSGEWRTAVVNIGERPTFGGTQLVVEAHLLDFAGDLYDARVRLSFHARLRGEERFPSAQALVERIQADVRAARELLPPPAAREV